MLRVIYIDPGKRTGWALSENWAIVDCGTVSRERLERLPPADFCVIELPRVYPNPKKWKGDPQHIVRLAALAGDIARRYPDNAMVEPSWWQGGSPPADVLSASIGRMLTEKERHKLRWPRPSVHAKDALGIACYVLRRRDPRRH